MTISLRDLLEQSEFWAFAFALGAIMLNWPMLSLAIGEPDVLGTPSILVYIGAVWLAMIALAFFFDWRHKE
jgi:NADH:ubiquinone oxidoreductase subunit 6 (subunit J)